MPSQLRPSLALVRGAGELVEPLPEPAAHAAVLLPGGGGLSTAEVFAECDRLGLGRPSGGAGGAGRAAARRPPGAGASPLDYPELLVNDLEPAARSLRPDVGEALDALRDAGAPLAILSGSGPTAVGLFPDLAAASAAADGLDRDRSDRLRRRARETGRHEAAGREGERRATANGLLIAPPRSRWRVAYYFFSRSSATSTCRTCWKTSPNTLGAWTYLLVGFFAFAETGAFVGLVVPGETVMLLGGAVAGQGAIDLYLLIAIAWFAAWLGDTTSFFLGRRLGREFVIKHGPRVGISHERFEKVEDYFGRHGGKTIFIGRFDQPRPRLRPVHRRQLGDALPRLRPLQHPRHRALGLAPHPGRLLLLAQHRDRRPLRGPRRLCCWRR